MVHAHYSELDAIYAFNTVTFNLLILDLIVTFNLLIL